MEVETATLANYMCSVVWIQYNHTSLFLEEVTHPFSPLCVIQPDIKLALQSSHTLLCQLLPASYHGKLSKHVPS